MQNDYYSIIKQNKEGRSFRLDDSEDNIKKILSFY